MIENTRIFTVEITAIEKVSDICGMATQESASSLLKTEVKALGYDNVNVIKVQDFVRNIKEEGK